MCNQAARFNDCLTKVQDSINSHLKVIQAEKGKRKSATETQELMSLPT